jgi:erythromycin esterase
MKTIIVIFLSVIILAAFGCKKENVSAGITAEQVKQTLIQEQFANKVITLTSAEPTSPMADFDGLSTFLKDKQIIGVGEASHGTSEFYKLRQKLFQYGVANWGLKVLSVEIQFGAAVFLDDYIRTGQGNLTEILKNSGYWIYTTEEFAALIEWMKNYNVGKTEAQRLKIYGFDAQVKGAINSVSWLKSYFQNSDAAFLNTFNQATASISNGFPEFNNIKTQQEFIDAAPKISKDYQASINIIVSYLTNNKANLITKSSESAYKFALQQARILLLAVTQIGLTEEDIAFEFRDNYMAENVKWISEFENNEKVMVLAHNGHVKNDISVGIKKDVKWMGYRLKQLFGSKYYAIGFTFNEGGFRATDVNGAGIKTFTVKPNAQSLTTAFATLNKTLFFMDMGTLVQNTNLKGVLDRNYWFYNAAAAYDNNESNAGLYYNIAKSYDGVIHVEKTTGTRGL